MGEWAEGVGAEGEGRGEGGDGGGRREGAADLGQAILFICSVSVRFQVTAGQLTDMAGRNAVQRWLKLLTLICALVF